MLCRVPIPAFADYELGALRSACRSRQEFVFVDSAGTPLVALGVQYRWRRRMRDWSGTPIRFHDLRHTYATYASIIVEASVHALSGILGHSSIDITLDYYVKEMPTT